MTRATVAEFHKDGRGRLILFSLTVVKEETDRRDGRELMTCKGVMYIIPYPKDAAA